MYSGEVHKGAGSFFWCPNSQLIYVTCIEETVQQLVQELLIPGVSLIFGRKEKIAESGVV